MAKTLTDLLNARARVLLVGPPGIGKTGRILATCSELRYKPVVMRASLCERVDFGGALVPDIQAGVTRALPLELLHDLRTSTDPTVLFLDDLGQSPMDVQAALMRLFDTNALPPNVVIWGATNRPADRAGVSALCEPLRSRFDLAFALPTPTAGEDSPNGATLLHDWNTELEGWIEWAMDHEVAPEIIAWHRATTGRTLYAWKPSADPALRMPDYRTWESADRLYRSGLRSLNYMSATLGKPVAAEFLAFASLVSELPTPDQIRIDPNGAPVPTSPGALYLITSMLAASFQAHDASPFCTYLGRLPRVYGALLGKDLFRRHGARLGGQPAWVRWFTANQDLFTL